jgi:hypothetical protein
LTGVTFKASSCTAKTTSSLTVEGGITDLGDGEITEKGFLWRVSDGITPTLDNCDGSQASNDTSNDSFSYTISGLQYGSSYNVRTYVKSTYNWETFVSYGDVITCETNDYVAATLKDISCTAQTTTSLTVEGGITDMGNGTFVEKGFVWRIGDSYTPSLTSNDGSQVSTSENNSSYTTELSGLEAGTTYSIRAYVKTVLDQQEVIAYSNTITSTTNDYVAATMKAISCTAQTTTTLTVESGITDMGNGEFVEKGFLWRSGSSGTPTLENCDGSLNVDDTDRSAYSATIKDLYLATSYRLRGYVKTTVEGTTLVAYTNVITATTKDVVSATMKSVSTSRTEDCTIRASSGIRALGTGELVEKGFCWKIDSAPTLEDCDGYQAVTDGSDELYSLSITGLHYNSTYYICAYVKTKIDEEIHISYSTSSSHNTRLIDFPYSTSLSENGIEIGMSCDESYMDKMSDWGAAIVQEGDNEIVLNNSSYLSAEKDSDTNKYVVKFTNIKTGTTYVIRMRAKYNGDYYIYNNTSSIESLKGPSMEDMDDPAIK